ncbi:MAG TPA: cellulose biosynthesis cyclic di-GMP-binding regulatory protein BcsB, partial [Clostridia bacterium]|nr:cellulose biosynthesis cyclic di-GMP-binding regulatory protein BcsB [Clostridia bacterium]
MPWAYVSEDSTLFLPLGKAGALNLSNRPAPFQRDGRLNDILVVVSDAPSAEDLRLLGRTMLLFGAGSDAYGTLRAVRAANFNEREADANIIAVGTPATNAFLRRVNGQLYFAFNEGFDRFVSNEKQIFDDTYAQKAGAIQLLPSPFSEERAMLVLTAAEEEGLTRLNRFVSEEKLRWGLQNDAALIDARGRTTAYQFAEAGTQNGERPSIGQTIAQDRQSTVFTLVAVGVIFILLLAVALVLVRARLRRKD